MYFSKLLSELKTEKLKPEYFSFVTTFSNLMLIVSKNEEYYSMMKDFLTEYNKKFFPESPKPMRLPPLTDINIESFGSGG